jgi:hypothetical protein
VSSRFAAAILDSEITVCNSGTLSHSLNRQTIKSATKATRQGVVVSFDLSFGGGLGRVGRQLLNLSSPSYQLR